MEHMRRAATNRALHRYNEMFWLEHNQPNGLFTISIAGSIAVHLAIYVSRSEC